MDERTQFIAKLAAERKKRIAEKAFNDKIVYLQAAIRGQLYREKFSQDVRKRFDSLFEKFVDLEKDKDLIECETMLQISQQLLRLMKLPDDSQRLSQLCRCIILSLSSPNLKFSFAALILSKMYIKSTNRLIINVFNQMFAVIKDLDLDRVVNGKTISLFVHFMISFMNCNSWAVVRNNSQIVPVLNKMCDTILCSALSEPHHCSVLSKALVNMVASGRLLLSSNVFNGLFNVVFKVLKTSDYSTTALLMFIQNFLTCPSLTCHLSPISLELLTSNSVFGKTLNAISSVPEILKDLTINQNLFLLANLVHLSFLDRNGLVENLLDWTKVLGYILGKFDKFTTKKKANRSNWHPIFGWSSESFDRSTEGALPSVAKQLQHLWSKPIICCLFDKILLHYNEGTGHSVEPSIPQNSHDFTSSVQKLWKKLNSLRTEMSLDVPAHSSLKLSLTAVVCQLYQSILSTLKPLHTDILSGLCREDFLLPELWNYISSLSPADCGLSYHLSLISMSPPPDPQHFAPLTLFTKCAHSVISILDEKEMYEKGEPFSIGQLIAIAKLCNCFCFKSVWNGFFDSKRAADSQLFSSVYQLCMLLYNRDSRRQFTKDQKFWLAPDVKSSLIITEFEKNVDRAVFLMSRMSHLVNLHERIVLFRKYIALEKESFEHAPSLMITVQRNRLLEDGYRQLSVLPVNALKATIRVKFVNQQGLDEAGIDQDGVFKEFLELILKRVFHPDLNLFKSSANGQLFPSPTSYVHENHLALFQFIGRMLAKAVYEGIVTEVHLAPVILATVLDRKLCAFDELSQLDPDLYKSLTYVKHYARSGDVDDLSLTFSIDEDYLGCLQTIDLVPGGRAIQVTNANRIAYVHRMAHYRVYSQTKEQCRALVAGFLSLLNANWLSLFSPHELQYLISGQTSDIDLHDLRRHVQYYGGFHNNHRVIKWLWQILEAEFDANERHLFLKFVTSCSRAPLLGFAYLEPRFSIRCVEVSDDQDQGDTLASVVRGFLAIKRQQTPTRLPTASTCFNLLKLPNYGKKSVLLQKLRYAIHAETGFELS